MSLKAGTQRALLKLGVYHSLKESPVYDIYWKVFNARIVRQRDQEVEFYRTVLKGLRPGALIFDVGAIEGAKTDVFLRLGARVVAVEPDASNQEALAGRFHRWPQLLGRRGQGAASRQGQRRHPRPARHDGDQRDRPLPGLLR